MFQEDQFLPYRTADLPAGPAWLVFAPHPDDETFGLGGTLRLGSRQGICITLVVLTDGGLGGIGEDLVAIREAEVQEAARRLGIHEVFLWRQRDRDLRVTDVLIEQVAALVREKTPASVFFTSPFEPHPDHRATASLVWEGIKRCDEFSGTAYAYEVGVQCPANRLIDISPAIDEKKTAMAVYTSQMTQNHYSELMQALNRSRTYTLPLDVAYAEALYAYDKVEGQLQEKIIDCLAAYWQEEALSDKASLTSVINLSKSRPDWLKQYLWSEEEKKADLIRQVKDLQSSMAMLNQEMDKRDREWAKRYQSLITSRSWRLMAPLRICAEWIRSLRKFITMRFFL